MGLSSVLLRHISTFAPGSDEKARTFKVALVLCRLVGSKTSIVNLGNTVIVSEAVAADQFPPPSWLKVIKHFPEDKNVTKPFSLIEQTSGDSLL